MLSECTRLFATTGLSRSFVKTHPHETKGAFSRDYLHPIVGIIPTGNTVDADSVIVAVIRTVAYVVTTMYATSENIIGGCCRLAYVYVHVSRVVPWKVVQKYRSADESSGEMVDHAFICCTVQANGRTVDFTDSTNVMIWTPAVTG